MEKNKNTNTHFQDEIQEAIEEVRQVITEQGEHIHVLESLSETSVVDEELWHRICHTPLRSTDIMGQLAKNIFPDAENIEVHGNGVYFKLMGFNVCIPTYVAYCILVDTSWYASSLLHDDEELELSLTEQRIQKYFELVDSGKAKWYEKARYCVKGGTAYHKWYLWILWTAYYKHHTPDRQMWNETLRRKKEEHERRIAEKKLQRTEQHKKAVELFTHLIPVLRRFSNDVLPYSSTPRSTSIAEIAALENIPYVPFDRKEKEV